MTRKVPKTVWLKQMGGTFCGEGHPVCVCRLDEVENRFNGDTHKVWTIVARMPLSDVPKRLNLKVGCEVEVHWPSLKPVKPKQPTRKGT